MIPIRRLAAKQEALRGRKGKMGSRKTPWKPSNSKLRSFPGAPAAAARFAGPGSAHASLGVPARALTDHMQPKEGFTEEISFPD